MSSPDGSSDFATSRLSSLLQAQSRLFLGRIVESNLTNDALKINKTRLS
jgi:hypothetical protein